MEHPERAEAQEENPGDQKRLPEDEGGRADDSAGHELA